MEGTKPTSSSFTSDLFGSKESSASSTSGIFGSIFPPPSKGHGSETVQPKQDPVIQARNAKGGYSGSTTPSNEGASQTAQNKQTNSYYQNQNEKVQPCHLSSSIYYGGQDVYSFPQNNQNSNYTTFNKDNGEDDSGSASRGNWWQGSLYY